jgi:hypothetical protein
MLSANRIHAFTRGSDGRDNAGPAWLLTRRAPLVNTEPGIAVLRGELDRPEQIRAVETR